MRQGRGRLQRTQNDAPDDHRLLSPPPRRRSRRHPGGRAPALHVRVPHRICSATVMWWPSTSRSSSSSPARTRSSWRRPASRRSNAPRPSSPPSQSSPHLDYLAQPAALALLTQLGERIVQAGWSIDRDERPVPTRAELTLGLRDPAPARRHLVVRGHLRQRQRAPVRQAAPNPPRRTQRPRRPLPGDCCSGATTCCSIAPSRSPSNCAGRTACHPTWIDASCWTRTPNACAP